MSPRTRASRAGLVASLLLVTGCGAEVGSCSIFSPNGLAGNGSFDYDCTGAGDTECDDSEIVTVGGHLPSRPIARGASFRLTYLNRPKTVHAVSRSAVSASGETFVVHRPGFTGFFVDADASDGDGDSIEDAIRLNVAEAVRIGIARMVQAGFGETSLPIGASITFRATPFAKDAPLAGALPVSWEIVDDRGLAELDVKSSHTCDLTAVRSGRVTLRARFEDLVDEVGIVIAERRGETEAGDGDAGDAGDAGTDASEEAFDAALD